MPLVHLRAAERCGQRDMLLPALVFHPQFIGSRRAQDVLTAVVTGDDVLMLRVVKRMGNYPPQKGGAG
jgi:hypothetical protein